MYVGEREPQPKGDDIENGSFWGNDAIFSGTSLGGE